MPVKPLLPGDKPTCNEVFYGSALSRNMDLI
jgi:hypothetical protein